MEEIMNKDNAVILLREAVTDDAPFIARCVLAGIELLHIEDELPLSMQPIFERMVAICLRDDTLYSYRNTVVAEVNGILAGALVAYDGTRYPTLRKTTFDLLEQDKRLRLEQNSMETGEGEYYLDSMAVMPQFRGLNIGKMLMQNRIDYASYLNIDKVTLLVDQQKPRLQAYYESLGFTFVEVIFVFGSWYNKLLRS